jgi:ankyrin repeat protein
MEATLLPLLMQLFDSDDPTIFCRWIALLRSITPQTGIYLPGRYASRHSVLHHAAFHNLKATTQRLLEKGADVNEVGGAAGGTVLHAACRGGSGDVVCELLERGADHRVRNEGGYTAYYLSVRRRAADVLEIFHELRSMSAEDKRELATVIGSDEAGCLSDSSMSWSPQIEIASGLSLVQRSRSSSRGYSPSLGPVILPAT